MLTDAEINKWERKYEHQSETYRSVAGYILGEIHEYKKAHPKTVRIVFSREPVLKSFPGILKKIEEKREKEEPNYDYDDLPDIIALTVLFPYHSDSTDFKRWMFQTFDARPAGKTALRADPYGHRGEHYILSARPDVLRSHPDYARINCELQIKTILEEAFDAKTHDLTYKPGEREISEDLKGQFGLLSSGLKIIDEQSEFLKGLLLEEEREVQLRRKACILVYFKTKTIEEFGAKLSIDVNRLTGSDISEIDKKLKQNAKDGISRNLCSLATLCALTLDDEYLKREALGYAEKLCMQDQERVEVAKNLLTRGSINWALSHFEQAIRDVCESIKIASDIGDASLLVRRKNSFIYFVADWKSVMRKEKEEWLKECSVYVEELDCSAPQNLDQ